MRFMQDTAHVFGFVCLLRYANDLPSVLGKKKKKKKQKKGPITHWLWHASDTWILALLYIYLFFYLV